MSSVNKGLKPSTVGETDVLLYRVPQCCVAAKPFKTGELKLTYVSLNLSTKRSDKSMYIGTRMVGGNASTVWLQPQIIYEKEGQSGFICPAWFVDTTAEKHKVNVQVVWKMKNDIYMPTLENVVPLNRGDRLYRLLVVGGEHPAHLTKDIAKLAKRSATHLGDAAAPAKKKNA